MDLSGRRALITGGAGHVGRAAAETLLELGASVALLDRDGERVTQRAADLQTMHVGRDRDVAAVARSAEAEATPPKQFVTHIVCDLEDEAATRTAVRDVTQRLGGLDIVINAAAFVGTTQVEGWAVPFEQQSVSAWDRALRVNVTSAFVIAQEARDALMRSGHGSVIFIGSIYGSSAPDAALYEGTAMANPAGYGASKGGVVQLARYLSTSLAPSVRVNTLSPGGIERQQPDAFRRRYEARTPLKRMAREEDLKGAIAYLASDLSAYVTGQELFVDGGWTTW
jgi:NAD(P)-dependent dehydrogenase (short-subunit alcohol dehydrogenase family)